MLHVTARKRTSILKNDGVTVTFRGTDATATGLVIDVSADDGELPSELTAVTRTL